jgi:iron complex outermembrane receptor protein
VTNLADKEYISTVGSNGFVESDPNGSFQTLLRGAPRQFFFSAKARF